MTNLAQSVSDPKAAIPTLRSNFVWTFAGNVSYGACQWGILCVITKLGDASLAGEFTLGLAISAPVFMFTMLQLRYVQATDTRTESGFADYFSLRLLTTILGLMAIVALLPFTTSSTAVAAVVFLVSTSKCVEAMSDVTAGLLQREEKLKLVSISLMLRGIFSITAFSLTFVYSRNMVLSVAAMSGAWLTVFLSYDLTNVRRFIGRHGRFFSFDRRELWRLTLQGLPLGWVATFSMLIWNIPRYFLEHYRGLAEQGIYASIAYPVVALYMVVLALTQSVTTRMAVLFAKGELRSFVRLLSKLSMLGVLIPVAGVPLTLLVGHPLVTLLYKREYADHIDLLALFVGNAGLITIVAFVFCGLTAARKFKVQVPIYILGLAITLAASALLIPHYGLMGGGVAFLLSQVTLALGGILVMYRVLRETNSRTAEPVFQQRQSFPADSAQL